MPSCRRYKGSESDSRFRQQHEQETNPCYFTLDTSMPNAGSDVCDPSAIGVSSNYSPFSLVLKSNLSDNTEQRNRFGEFETNMLRAEANTVDSFNCWLNNGMHNTYSTESSDSNEMVELLSRLDIGKLLINCAKAVSDNNLPNACFSMHVLEEKVSVSGEPCERLGAYMLEALRARLESSGTQIYKALKCDEPTSSELLTYMSILYQICPYWKFAYTSANAIITEVMENEPKIHIIDFQIAQGTQWMLLMRALASRAGGPPRIRITGVDDSQSAHARGGGLEIVGKRLSDFAASLNVSFEFHTAGMVGFEVKEHDLMVPYGEPLTVNFPYVLHHIPDESVNMNNHRDELLRLVKSLSPKVVTIVEQESNTNTSSFIPRFCETLEYYTAMFESIDASTYPRDDQTRIKAEQNCVARDIVNMIACEGAERIERHELFGKWRSRLTMASFSPHPLSSLVNVAVDDVLKDYSDNYRLMARDGALFLAWKGRVMATCSAWK